MTDRNSTQITNARATPVVKSGPEIKGRLLSTLASLTAGASDTAASVFTLATVPSNAQIRSIKLSCADATTAGKLDMGVYQTPDNGSASVDSDFFSNAFDLSAGPFNRAEMLANQSAYTMAKRAQPLWQALGLSSDPHRDYDISATVDTTFNGGPTALLFEIEFVV